MTFGGFSAVTFWLGLAVLGGVLAALQFLRVRHREVPVATTLFWRQALEETRARVFRHRFRHLGAWMLLFLICGLLWLACARPQWSGGGESRTVCLLDGSAGMAREGRFEAATTRLAADVAGLPAPTTQVLFVGGPTYALLLPGEDRLLLSRRLDGVRPVRAPSRMADAIRALAREGSEPLTVRVYGDASVPPAGSLPDHMTVLRATPADDTRATEWGVTVLGQAEAISGRTDAVDLLVELRGDPLARAPTIVLATEAEVLDAQPIRSSDRAGHVRLRFVDLRANGRTVRVRTDDDPEPLATIVLADHPVLRVAVAEELLAVFVPVLDADPGLVLAEGEADVRIARDAGDTPTLAIVSAPDAEHAIAVTAPGPDAEALLTAVQEDLSLAEIDGAALARALDRVVSVGAASGERRSITLWRSLLDSDVGFIESRAFPLFVAKALRWLADQDPLHPFVAAGEPLPTARAGAYWYAPRHRDRDLYAGTMGSGSMDPVGSSFTPPVVGRYLDARDVPVEAALLDLDRHGSRTTGAADAAAAPGTPVSLVTLILLAVFALLGLEWVLFRTGRVP